MLEFEPSAALLVVVHLMLLLGLIAVLSSWLLEQGLLVFKQLTWPVSSYLLNELRLFKLSHAFGGASQLLSTDYVGSRLEYHVAVHITIVYKSLCHETHTRFGVVEPFGLESRVVRSTPSGNCHPLRIEVT